MPLSAAIAGSSGVGYLPPMPALIIRVLTLAALVLMPFGMSAAVARTVQHSPPATAHCGNHSGQPDKRAPDQPAGCTAACAMLIVEPVEVESPTCLAAPTVAVALAKSPASRQPEIATPPPKRS